MANQDNPIFRVVNETLGLGGGPKSFEDQTSRLRAALDDAGYVFEAGRAEDVDIYRKAGKSVKLRGFERVAGKEGTEKLFEKIQKAGLIPNSSKTAFMYMGQKEGAEFFYKDKSLFYAREGQIAPLPLQFRDPNVPVGGAVYFGDKIRQVSPSIYDFDEKQGLMRKGQTLLPFKQQQDFIDVFYKSYAYGQNFDYRKSITGATTLERMQQRGLMLESGLTPRGIYTPELSFFTQAKPTILAENIGLQVTEAGKPVLMEDFRSGFNILTKSAGFITTGDGRRLAGLTEKTIEQQFEVLNRKRSEYFGKIAAQFTSSAAGPSSFVFVKPDYLGGTRGLKITGEEMTRLYGTQFEEHSLSKGLYQLAHSGKDPFGRRAPFAIRGMEDFSSDIMTGMRVAVVETKTLGQSQALFGEGGTLFTPEGAKKFARQLPAGSAYLSGPSADTIGSVERLFNINLGAGDVLEFGDDPRVLRAAGNKGALQHLRKALGSQAGILDPLLLRTVGEEVLGRGLVGLSKIERTETGLKLDFATRDRLIAPTTEMILSGRRGSAILTQTSHPLYGVLNSRALRDIGVDALMSVDEFKKTMGAQVFVTNFIDQVSKREDAARIFQNVFGHHGWQKGQQVMFEDFDSGFTRAVRAAQPTGYLSTVKGGSELIRAIEEGEALSFGKVEEKLGITGARVFGMAGTFRTDFMGDINMLNPLRMTAAKMVTLASGYRSLGYKTALEDPLVDLFTRSSRDYRGKGANFQIDEVTGRLKLGKNNIVRRFAEILSGVGAFDSSHSNRFAGATAIIGKDGLYLGGKKLNLLPDMKQFAFSEGGMSLTQLKNTILDPKKEMVYLDLGQEVELNVAGKARKLRQLPIPVGLLRKAKGPYERVVMGADDPAYKFIEAVREIEQTVDFDNLRPGQTGAQKLGKEKLNKLVETYGKIAGSILGKEGLVEKASSINLYGGTRARLAPSGTDFFLRGDRNTVEKLFTAEVNRGELYDYLNKKSYHPAFKKQAKYITEALEAGKQDIFVMLSADPAQRAEHFQVMKLHVTGKSGFVTQKIGQLNVSVSPMWMKLMERDLDRDVINFLPLSGMNVEGKTTEEIQEALAKRYNKQKDLMRHYVHLYGAQMSQQGEQLADRILGVGVKGKLTQKLREGKEAIKNLGEFLIRYEGGQYSAGYTIVRSGEDVMATLAARVTGVSAVDDIERAVSSGLAELGYGENRFVGQASMYAKFMGEEGAERLAATRSSLQALYQGAVQKGAGKGGLEDLGKFIAETGQSITEGTFDYDKSLRELTGRIESVIQAQAESGKLRAFYDLDYIAKTNSSLAPMLEDLARGAGEVSKEKLAQIEGSFIKQQATLISEFLLPGIMTRRKLGAPSIAEDIMRGQAADDEAGIFRKLFRAVKGSSYDSTPFVVDDDVVRAEQKLLGESAEATKGVFGSLLDFMSKSSGRAFAGGIGVGIVAATAVRSIMSNEAPMARDIDTRQPMDQGPSIFSSAPRIYGSSSPMHASRGRNPVSPTSIDGYSMYSSASPHVSISDKRSAFDPHLIDSHIRSVAHSDYTY